MEESKLNMQAAEKAAATASISSPITVRSPVLEAKRMSGDMERLGMGFKKLGMTSPPVQASRKSASSAADEITTAREKFGTQKAISSDMYFGRNAYDPTTQAEAQTRLQNFQGATSISSNQYFGREEQEGEDDDGAGTSYRGGGGGAGGTNDTLAAAETAARDALQRIMENPDVQNAAESIRSGAMKLSSYLAEMSSR